MSGVRTKGDLMQIIWRNHPTYITTFGSCCECKTESARGGGLCAKCAEKQLGILVGEELASQFHEAVRVVKRYEQTIADK